MHRGGASGRCVLDRLQQYTVSCRFILVVALQSRNIQHKTTVSDGRRSVDVRNWSVAGVTNQLVRASSLKHRDIGHVAPMNYIRWNESEIFAHYERRTLPRPISALRFISSHPTSCHGDHVSLQRLTELRRRTMMTAYTSTVFSSVGGLTGTRNMTIE